jgi:hypothetical protein
MAIQLTPEQIDELTTLRSKMGQLADEIERAERAGIDVTELKTQFVTIENLRAGLLKEYGPGSKRRKVS